MDPQAYGCCLSALTRFTRDPSHGVRPSSPGGHADNGRRKRPRKGIQSCYSGLQVQGTADSPPSTALFSKSCSPKSPIVPRPGGESRKNTRGRAPAAPSVVTPVPRSGHRPGRDGISNTNHDLAAPDHGTLRRETYLTPPTRRPSPGAGPSRRRAQIPSGPRIPSRCGRAWRPRRDSPSGCRERGASWRRRRR